MAKAVSMEAVQINAAAHLGFLTNIETLLREGRFTSTYKFALLLSLANIAVEQGSDSGEALDVDLNGVARQYIALYWNMARPYPLIGDLLKQNREQRKPARMITLIGQQARQSINSYRRFRKYQSERDALVSSTRVTLARDVLYRLQTIGGRSGAASQRFLYDHPPTAAECARLTHITLKPGVCACLRRLHGVIVSMVQSRWALWVRQNNPSLHEDGQLETFLFGANRTAVSEYAQRLYDLQDRRCFYSGNRLTGPRSAEVDHFIPWARYPCDSPFNLVLSSRAENNRMRDMLKPLGMRQRWEQRNESDFDRLVAPETEGGFGASASDRELVRAVAGWLYGNALRRTG